MRLLLEMNDVTYINWKRISRLMPKERKYALDMAPTIDELRLLMPCGDLRFQAQLEGLVSQPMGEKGEQVLSRGRSLSKGTSTGNSGRVVKSEEVHGLLEDGCEPMRETEGPYTADIRSSTWQLNRFFRTPRESKHMDPFRSPWKCHLSDQFLAVLELMKNSYDADAESVIVTLVQAIHRLLLR